MLDHMVSYGFSSRKTVYGFSMYRCESWPMKKVEHERTDGFQTVVLEKTLENPLDSKEIKAVNSKGNQHWED